MNIVAQSPVKVKPDFTEWQEKKSANIKMAKRMSMAGFKRRAFMMEHCGDYIMFGKCESCGHIEVQHANLCRDRLCPVCQWRLSRQLFGQMCRTLTYIQDLDYYTAGFLTLTVKNCQVKDLSATLKKMAEAWDRMLHDRTLKHFVAGWARSVEITYNKKTGEFHPHYHIIVLFDDMYGEGQTRQMLNDLWFRSFRSDYVPITDFRLIKDLDGDNIDLGHAIAETYKYSVKHDACEQMPLATFREFVQQISGKRFQSYGGVIKKARQDLNIDEETELDEEGTKKCTLCGGDLQKVVAEWSFTHDQYVFILQTAKAGQ